MALESPQLAVLAAALAAYDDEALAALANKGLVRRARKDLEKSVPTLLGHSDGTAQLKVEDATVQLPATPAQARCTCGGGGPAPACRHILAAIMFLRDQAAPATTAAATPAIADESALKQEILAITEDALESWAGRPLYRKALRALSGGSAAAFEPGPALTIRLPDLNVAVRWMPGRGLPGMLCECHAAGPCEHKVAAVAALWAAHGRQLAAVETATLEASAGAPRTRQQVLASVHQVLREIIALGLSRLSEATRQRCQTLAVSAHGVDLPRLERMLRGLADEIRLLTARDAAGSTENFLASAARTWCLCRALGSPTPALVGQHRSRYDPVAGELDLLGLGARQWRTRSGYEGLTVYFWDAKAKRWLTWTESRPVGTPSFVPASRYTQDGPWLGVTNPREAARSRYRLTSAFRNNTGRLSGRSGTRAVLTGPTPLGQVPAIQQWTDLAAPLERLYGGGLAERREEDELVLLAPADVLPPLFDQVQQHLIRGLVDASGRMLPMVIRHDDRMPGAVALVERTEAPRIKAVLGLLRGTNEGVCVEPVTFLLDTGPVHITLDGIAAIAPNTPAAPSPAAASTEAESPDVPPDEEDESIAPAETCSRVGEHLRRMLETLDAIAEAGLHVARDLSPLAAQARALGDIGLTGPQAATQRAIDALDKLRRGAGSEDAAAGALLEAAYVLRLGLHQELVARWLAALSTPTIPPNAIPNAEGADTKSG